MIVSHLSMDQIERGITMGQDYNIFIEFAVLDHFK